MNVREFIKKYPENDFDMMTPGGFVYLTAEQAKELLAGGNVKADPCDPAYAIELDASLLLSERVLTAKWKGRLCHMMTDYMQESEEHKEVEGMEDHDREKRLITKLKAGYETYIEGMMRKPVSEVIEMAPEISVAKLIYEEMSVEGAFTEYAAKLLQMENPFETLRNRWLSEQGGDHHEELDHLLWRMSEQDPTCNSVLNSEGIETSPAVKQEVAMC